MSKSINWEEFSKEAAKQIREGKGLTGKDGIFTPLIKEVLEAAMDGELDEHLEETRKPEDNRRNGHTRKTVKSSLGAFEILTPRDRNSTFEPETIGKRQRLLPDDLEDKIIGLYGIGASYLDIRTHLREMYGVEVSDGTINKITDRIIPTIRDWQSRPLEAVYPIVWMDAIHFKIRDSGKVITKAVYSVLGVNLSGNKEVLGLYIGDNESARFWLQVLTDLSERGVKDILIASIDNLRGFSDAIETIFPKTDVQLCIVHQIRNTLKYVSWKDYKELLRDLKKVYRASTEELASHNFEEFKAKWESKYPKAIKSWENNWVRLTNYFKYPPPIRKIIYTTNTVEGYHRMVRKVTKSKGAFTSDMAMLKLVYLATIQFQNRWTTKVREWNTIINQLFIYFEDRIDESDTV
jgi:putative transposase